MSGLRNETTQKLQLTEKDLTLQLVLEKLQSLETAQKNTQVMKGKNPLSVGRVSETHQHRGQSGHASSTTSVTDAVA